MNRVIHRTAGAARTLAVVAAVAVPSLASAHGSDSSHHHTAFEALTHGFAHPFTGVDHLAAMVALGVWSALTARRVWTAPLAFAVTLLTGALLGMQGVALPAIEPMIASSLLALGLLLATGLTLPTLVGAGVVGAFALFHGIAHGLELAGEFPLAALVGMVAATAALHVLGLIIGRSLSRRPAWMPRLAGSAVALFGLALLVPLR